MENYYSVLNVKQSATEDEIKKAYREQVKKYHPDVFQDDKKFAEEQFAKIAEAYEILSDATKRMEYDEKLRREYASRTSAGFATHNPEQTAYKQSYVGGREDNKTAGYSFSDRTRDGNIQNVTSRSNQNEKRGMVDPIPRKRRGCCLWILIKYIFYFWLIVSLYRHFVSEGLTLDQWKEAWELTKEQTLETSVQHYFQAIQKGDLNKANAYTTSEFESYNDAVIGVLHSVGKGELYEPLFQRIRQFQYEIKEIHYNDKDETTAVVIVQCKNFDAYEIVLEFIQIYGMDAIYTMPIEEINAWFSERFCTGELMMLEDDTEIKLKKENGKWVVTDFDEKRDLANVLVGNIYRLEELEE